MTAQYELAVLGNPSPDSLRDLERHLNDALSNYHLGLGKEVAWNVLPRNFVPNEARASAAVYFGPQVDLSPEVPDLLARSIPILPVASSLKAVAAEIPERLRPINCLGLAEHGIPRVATALLECAGLLPKQRRVFISYKRTESRDVAVQLFDALSARCFDVFLDTHGVSPGEDFQAVLWHRLCDCDAVLMLDTESYFESRWTDAEFGRALAKGISVLRVGWPGFSPSPRVKTTSRVDLVAGDFQKEGGILTEAALDRICLQLETVRSQSLAVRNLNLVGSIRNALERIGGQVQGVGLSRSIYATLPDGRPLTIYPTVGVPTAVTMHDACELAGKSAVAVVYDHVGLHPRWQTHLNWLGEQIQAARWMRISEAAWDLAGWSP